MDVPVKNKTLSFYLDILAYVVFFVFVVIHLGAFVAPFARVVELLYPVLALATAFLFLWRKPAFYLALTWVVWFTAPELRRVVDYHTSYSENSLIILTPFLVAGIAFFPALKNVTRLAQPLRFPLALVSLGLVYAYVVGVVNNGLLGATFDLLNTHQENRDIFRRATITTFTWSLLVMGLYGLVQFLYVPSWDAYWMTQALLVDNLNSIGTPEPFKVRVFSTLNAPGPFAIVLMAGLLLLLSSGGVLRWFALASGLLGFGLSLVRSAWGGWVVGLCIFAANLPLRARLRFLGLMFVLVLLAIPLFSVGPVADVLGNRFDTFTDLQSDISFRERLALYGDLPSFVSDNLLGQGLGSTGVATGLTSRQESIQNLDSGIIAVLYSFGILGSLYFVVGTVSLLFIAFRLVDGQDAVNTASFSITVAAFSQIVFGNAWTGVSGAVLWFFLCFLLSAYPQSVKKESLTVAAPFPLERGHA
jgi:hypothetical protein